MCEDEGGPVIVPYVEFPEGKSQPEDWSWNCKCLQSFKSRDVDLLLDPMVSSCILMKLHFNTYFHFQLKENDLSSSAPHNDTDAAGNTIVTEQLGEFFVKCFHLYNTTTWYAQFYRY